VNRQAVGVVDKTKPLELHHEMTDPRSRRPDHLRLLFLINSREDRFGAGTDPFVHKRLFSLLAITYED
jgi:hypothetical protein